MNLATQAKQARKSLIEECDAGLVKIIVPVFVKKEFIGVVGACGFLLDDGEVDPFLVNMTTGIDEEEIERLSTDINKISTEKAENIVSYIEDEIVKIVDKFDNK
jgi:ligand-binding sensor protein